MVVYKQVDAGMYSPSSYVLSVILVHLPLAVTECTFFCTLLYWMSDFSHDAGRFVFFILVVLLTNLSLGGLFRWLAYITQNPNIAINFGGPITAVFMLFGGFLITSEKIPNYAIWLFYLSPFSWGFRSNAQNEFFADRYSSGLGNRYLDVWQINTNPDYKVRHACQITTFISPHDRDLKVMLI
jgi:ABC-type multidrug transport system permease subunit